MIELGNDLAFSHQFSLREFRRTEYGHLHSVTVKLYQLATRIGHAVPVPDEKWSGFEWMRLEDAFALAGFPRDVANDTPYSGGTIECAVWTGTKTSAASQPFVYLTNVIRSLREEWKEYLTPAARTWIRLSLANVQHRRHHGKPLPEYEKEIAKRQSSSYQARENARNAKRDASASAAASSHSSTRMSTSLTTQEEDPKAIAAPPAVKLGHKRKRATGGHVDGASSRSPRRIDTGEGDGDGDGDQPARGEGDSDPGTDADESVVRHNGDADDVTPAKKRRGADAREPMRIHPPSLDPPLPDPGEAARRARYAREFLT